MLKLIFKFYINSSIHVALAVCGLCLITFKSQGFPYNPDFFGFVFFASITGYNFVKYAGVAKLHHRSLTDSLKAIQIFSLISFVLLCYFTFKMPRPALLGVSCLGILTLLYALPVFPKERNLRTVSGLKVYIIAVVWACTAGLLPYLYFEVNLSYNVILQTIQFALFILAITLPFEIRDLRYDATNLHTIPQKIGVATTKWLGVLLLLLMVVLEFFKDFLMLENVLILIVTVCISNVLIAFSNKKQSQYYCSFWVESLPILWALLALVVSVA